jgi:predicted enzyme related to lactoylglutathione lyase
MKKNSVVHFEIYGDDAAKLSQFYTSLFDWSVTPVPGMDYRMVGTVDTDGKGMPTKPGGINGGMTTRPAGFNPTSWVAYVNVESIEDTLERAQKLGAKVTKGKSPVPAMGWFAMMIDPQGNHFAIWREDSNAK